jgi:hypothetical protein
MKGASACLGASMACLGLVDAQAQVTAVEPTMQDIEKIVSLDLAITACSTRLQIDGFRFNRAQNAWRLALVDFGKVAMPLYEKRREAGMQELLRVMANDESKGCKFAALKVKDLFAEKENPIVGVAELKP